VLGQLDRGHITRGPLELPLLQSLVPDRQSGSVPGNGLDPIRPLATNRNTSPESGSLPSASVIVAHRPSKDLRMSPA
jgi:hypothetical protein